ncbi:glycosyltransferase family 4 protein [Haladaptatus sp. CMAA 1911]|uniref:glycosyltransferase family 4 protein n=1 Tax=unclassified Haladaptatus TaxID=2622732 RepID=UPI00375415C7
MNIILGSHYYHPHIGGIESVVQLHAKKLAERGHDVTVITTDIGAEDHESERNGYNIKRYRAWNPFESIGIPYPIPDFVEARQKMNSLIKGSDVDIVHLHGLNYLTTTAMLLGLPTDIPVIIHQHTPFVEYSWPAKCVEIINDNIVGRWNLQSADLVCCVTEEIQQYVTQLDGEIDTTLLMNGVESDRFHPRRGSKESVLNCDSDTVAAFSLSRMSEKKGVDVLLNTVKKFKDYSKSIQFFIAGDGPMSGEVIQVASEHDNVEYLGSLSDKELKEYYSAADVFLFTSKSGEAFPTLTMIEAYASGTPVIASSLSKAPDGVEVGDNTILVSPNDENELIDALTTLAHNQTQLDRMSIEARTSAEQYFSIKSRIDRLESLYESVIAAN